VLTLRPLEEVSHCNFEKGNLLALSDADLAFRQSSSKRRLYLASDSRIALIRTLLNVLAVEVEVVSVNVPALIDRHIGSAFDIEV
jgi:hypothetical protein